MSGVNKVIIVGRLGMDPEVKYLADGTAVAKISVATSETWKDKQGVKQEKTEWHRVNLWRRLAEVAGEYLHKGSQVYVEGKLQTRDYTDKEGVKRWATEILAQNLQMLGEKGSGAAPTADYYGTPPPVREEPNVEEDDIPF